MGTRKAIWKHLTSAPDKHFLCTLVVQCQGLADSAQASFLPTIDSLLKLELIPLWRTSRCAALARLTGRHLPD